MSEKEQLIANLNASEEAIRLLEEKESMVTHNAVKYVNEIKSQGSSSGARVGKLFIYFILCNWLGVAVWGIAYMALEKIWEPLAKLAFPLLFSGLALWIYLCIIKPKMKEKNATSAMDELEALKQSPQLSWLPYDYRNSADIETIREAVQYDRVDSLREALQLCDLKNIKDAMIQYNYS